MTNILHITPWYPNEHDPQLGIFVKKHIRDGHAFAHNVVVAIIAHAEVRQCEVRITRSENFTEIIGYYRARPNNRWGNYSRYRKLQARLMEELLRFGFSPDIVHCHVAEKSVAFAKKHFAHTPRYVTEHWSAFLNGEFRKQPALQRFLRIRDINSCEALVTVSEVLKQALIAHGVKIPVTVIPNVVAKGVGKEQFNAPPRFLVVADLVDEVKDISGVITAFSAHAPQGSTLTIVGDGRDRQKLEALAKTTTAIHFEGRRDNAWVLDNLHRYDVLVVNSRVETFSVVTAEALLCGLAVIATRCGGPEQFVAHGENGLLIEPNAPRQLGQAMQDILPLLAAKTPRDMVASIEQKINLPTIQKAFMKLYGLA